MNQFEGELNKADNTFKSSSLKKPYKQLGLTIGKKKSGGRNNQGRITAYHRGGGNKLRYIYLNKPTHSLTKLSGTDLAFRKENSDSTLNKTNLSTRLCRAYSQVIKRPIQNVKNQVLQSLNYGEVRYLVRDPNRTAWIAGVYWSNDQTKKSTNPWYSTYSNILAPEGLTVGSQIDHSVNTYTSFVTLGKKAYLKDLMIGTIVHNIGGKYIRAAGCSGIIISKVTTPESTVTKVTVKLQSGQYKVFSGDTLASIGVLSNGDHKTRDYRKAGQKRWLGRRPIVRGVAMNPVDHPHGGGEGKSSGGRPSVTPWGKPTKGKPTRSPKKPKLVKTNKL